MGMGNVRLEVCVCVYIHCTLFSVIGYIFSCNSHVVFSYLKCVMNCPLCDDDLPHEISVCVQQHCSLLN